MVKLGFFTMPFHPLGKDWRNSLKEDREAVILADELGFTEAYIGEHSTDPSENITSNIVFLATLYGATRQIKLGTGTVNIPNTNPVTVASQIAMLDHLLDGRLIFGVSPGGLLSDAEAYGSIDLDRNEMFLEGMEHILKIWSSKAPYDLRGKHWTVSTQRTFISEIGQGVILPPLQRPHPPIVTTAASPYSKGLFEAAKRGWQPISANFLLPKWVATHWPIYKEGCEASGRIAVHDEWRVAKNIFVADSDAIAKAYVEDPNGPFSTYFETLIKRLDAGDALGRLKADPQMKNEDVTLDYVRRELVIYGSPSSVSDQLLKFRDTTGQFGTLLYVGSDWHDRELARRSMILMAEKVLQTLN